MNAPMSIIEEIKELENRMTQAELGPDPKFFEEVLADDAILDGARNKNLVVDAHQPGRGPKFTKVEMTDFNFTVHDSVAVVVTCKGTYEGPQWSGSLRFMRVWFKRNGKWQIIAGSTQGTET